MACAASEDELDINQRLVLLIIGDPQDDEASLLHTSARDERCVQFMAELLNPLDNEHRRFVLSLRDKNNCTPLHIAVSMNVRTSTIDLFTKALSSNQKFLFECLTDVDNDGNSALHLAIKGRKAEFVQTLLERLTSEKWLVELLCSQDDIAQSVLHSEVISCKDTQIIQAMKNVICSSSWLSLLQQMTIVPLSGDCNAVFQWSPLHLAIMNETIGDKLLKLFLGSLTGDQRKQALMIRDNTGGTVLHLAMSAPNRVAKEAVQAMLAEPLTYKQMVSLLSTQNNEDCNVLHIAFDAMNSRITGYDDVGSQVEKHIRSWPGEHNSLKGLSPMELVNLKRELIMCVLDSLNRKDILMLLNTANNNGQTPLSILTMISHSTAQQFIRDIMIAVLNPFDFNVRLSLLSPKQIQLRGFAVSDTKTESVFELLLQRSVLQDNKQLLKTCLDMLHPPDILQLLTESTLNYLYHFLQISVKGTVDTLSVVFRKLNAENCLKILRDFQFDEELTLVHLIASQSEETDGLRYFLDTMTSSTEDKLVLLHAATNKGVKPLHLAARLGNLDMICSVLAPLPLGTFIPFVMTMKSGNLDVDSAFSTSLGRIENIQDPYFMNVLQNWVKSEDLTRTSESLKTSGLEHILDYLVPYVGYEDHVLKWSDYRNNTMLHYAAMINHTGFILRIVETQNVCEVTNAVFQRNCAGYAPYYISTSRVIKNKLAWIEKQKDSYHLRHPPSVVIFYMEEGRPGAKEECKCLLDGFSRLGMHPIVIANPHEKDVYEKIRLCQQGDVSALIVAIMSHGDSGTVKLADKEMQIHDIIQQMNSAELKMIPKVLILQACQSEDNQHQRGVNLYAHSDALPGTSESADNQAAARRQNLENRKEIQLRLQAQRLAKRNHFDIQGPDMMIISSTINNAICSRNLMIPELVSLLDSSSEDTDLKEIAQLLIGRVREATGESQIPELRHTMKLKLCLKQIFSEEEKYKSELGKDWKCLIQDKFKVSGAIIEDKFKASGAIDVALAAAKILFGHVQQKAIEGVSKIKENNTTSICPGSFIILSLDQNQA